MIEQQKAALEEQIHMKQDAELRRAKKIGATTADAVVKMDDTVGKRRSYSVES